MAVPAETKELAYKVWRDHGQNLSETERVLNGEMGYVISRQSLHAWKTEYDWEGRAARAEAEERLLERESEADLLLLNCIKQRQRYETYFETLPVGTVDNNAVNTYNNILRNILNIRQKMETGQTVDFDRPKIFLEDMQFIAGVLQEIDPEGLKVFSRNFDQIVKRFKDENAKAA
ncbi:hypothetical protein PITCH_A1980006 [uncultured Desulfobacterium sp.]|jgi:hypothetical protein|uniref:Uncharacterized protein n=1 Tax=uncultured Desulfobacterium sp. TaxID=201089 RepID=A0A445MWI8_9BACT|nr:hypothetical protein PITCH_A1980006 [uncultured Desulfobacterium sp.]